ncbi:trehalose-6-phosphate synthase [soil metagenome]
MMDAGLVVASNRGPVSWRRADDGTLEPARGFGGLVTALGGALQEEPGTWVSVALDAEAGEVAARHDPEPFTEEVDGQRFRLRLLEAGDRYDPYYNVVSNRLLWFTLHELWGEPYEPSGRGWRDAWEDGYARVNHEVAAAIVDVAADDQAVFLQDYHLCLVAERVRQARPDVPILHYIHTPWVGPGALRRLPDPIAEGVVRGLLAADVVAFSAPAWADAFRACARELLGAQIDGEDVRHDGHRARVADFVLGVDGDDLAASAQEAATTEAAERLEAEANGRALLLRVDRSDLSKNILRGLHAYELLLEREPDLATRVWHYAHINPSRQEVEEYHDYLQNCRDAAERIAQRFGEDCITFSVTDDYPRAVAALGRYDVLLTNPVIDGTNLVAKEGPALNTNDGALVLSRTAGCAPVMGDGALLVNPYDVEQTADALHCALTMGAEERAARAATLGEAARAGDPASWLAAQRKVLADVVDQR